MTQTQTTTDSWDNLCGSNFLKTSHVKNEQDAFVVEGVELTEADDENPVKIRLFLENSNETFIFDLNITNANFCKNSGISSPNSLKGKKIYFKKVLVNSPKTKKEVESLRICKVE